MRIDKFLKVSRLIKRRSVAKDVADADRIYVNGQLAKPGKTVKVGDQVQLHLGLKIITIEITSLTLLKDQDMYTLISEEKRSL
ncbi:RNA-binding S4 domain-containing protein [Acholeplasma laidlawii]|uniref:S4 RNA-binding domain protein n=2 Tax=Acholeplasma laidlawii TaxID=2148 RepID=A9NE18_ACHLI|nr:RNA-binding S4 domain-containing protein [Acholeplasma laidlawii]ABX81978.1 S4 RNA-binding domain protein [Acholeplasma laidlawii PG-8A]NWH10959.1 RNA-binding S4 domain-containing protein [Acholeplasma laidlawii]NWH12345.1 RNA-binding S4 domain-containing protein [Acholeplasma laidlawii]NWH13731.1 RNA-binding S4 domain-containing protein [Acholeplasma laidlawii]NWH14947.1 RNA-binding S4 domain-containing protein [Acholeplasma laidlawii]